MAADDQNNQDAVPLTFRQRGVMLPLTTPGLNGGRIRHGARDALELMVPNPSGGRGQYVLPLDKVETYCSMTLHDRALKTRVQEEAAVTPAAVRRASRDVASQGFAGRAAAAAAGEAVRGEEQERMLTSFSLMLQLVREVDPVGARSGALNQLTTNDLERRARETVVGIAPALGCDAGALQIGLQNLASDLAPVGIGETPERARLPSALARLVKLRADLAQWANPAGRPGADLARFIISIADATLALAGETLTAVRREADNVQNLLRRNLIDPQGLALLFARPAWLLDGWDRLDLLWREEGAASPTELRLAEMVATLPLLPREVSGTGRSKVDVEALHRGGRAVEMNVDWRTARPVFDLVARNERQRALAA